MQSCTTADAHTCVNATPTQDCHCDCHLIGQIMQVSRHVIIGGVVLGKDLPPAIKATFRSMLQRRDYSHPILYGVTHPEYRSAIVRLVAEVQPDFLIDALGVPAVVAEEPRIPKHQYN